MAQLLLHTTHQLQAYGPLNTQQARPLREKQISFHHTGAWKPVQLATSLILLVQARWIRCKCSCLQNMVVCLIEIRHLQRIVALGNMFKHTYVHTVHTVKHCLVMRYPLRFISEENLICQPPHSPLLVPTLRTSLSCLPSATCCSSSGHHGSLNGEECRLLKPPQWMVWWWPWSKLQQGVWCNPARSIAATVHTGQWQHRNHTREEAFHVPVSIALPIATSWDHCEYRNYLLGSSFNVHSAQDKDNVTYTLYMHSNCTGLPTPHTSPVLSANMHCCRNEALCCRTPMRRVWRRVEVESFAFLWFTAPVSPVVGRGYSGLAVSMWTTPPRAPQSAVWSLTSLTTVT